MLARSANPLRVSDSSALHCEIASSGTRCSSFKLVMLVTLGGYHLLMAWWWSPSKHARKITRCYGEVIVRGVVLAPWEPRRGTLVVRVIELPSLLGDILAVPNMWA